MTYVSLAQCPTSGTISSNCTSSYWTPSGNVTVNSGVTVTVTNTLTLSGSYTITATGATINAGTFSDTWVNTGPNQITGGTYNITNDFTTSSGGNFTATNVTVNVSGNISFDPGNGSHTYTNSSFSVAGTAYFGDVTHTIDGTDFDFGTGFADPTAQTALTLNGGAVLNFTNSSTMDVKGHTDAGQGADMNINNSDVYVMGDFDNAGSGTIVVTNGGSFIVDGDYDNTGSGSTTVGDGGTLQVGGDFDNSGGGSELVIEDGGGAMIGGTYSGNAPSGSGASGGSCGGGGGGCCGDACGSLPVSLTFFEALRDKNCVLLRWETASEINNDYFNVHRSRDGLQFDVVAQVDGHGNSNEIIRYQWNDYTAKTGTFFYQLEQVDFDGKNEFFAMKRVDLTKLSSSNLSVHPVPVSFTQDIYTSLSSLDGEVLSARVTDLSGRISENIAFSEEFNRVRLHTSQLNLSPGIYMVTVSTSLNEWTGRITVK